MHKDFKLTEIHKRLEKIRETIDYRVKMEEISAQPKQKRRELFSQERYTSLSSKYRISSIIESPLSDERFHLNTDVDINQDNMLKSDLNKTFDYTGVSKVREGLMSSLVQASQINNFIDQPINQARPMSPQVQDKDSDPL